MKKIYSSTPFTMFLFLIFFSSSTYAQIEIQGKVSDQHNAPLPFSTVSLLKENLVLSSIMIDSIGRYRFSDLVAEEYQLSITYLGNTQVGPSFLLRSDTTIDIVFSGRKSTLLDDVTITGTKPLLERKVDRLIFNLANAPGLQGIDMAEALANTPMIKASEDGLSIVGKSGVGIMVNDRLLPISGKELVSYLKTLRSDDIERIEIITTPPAKYEARGNGGLINLILKKNPNNGLSGNLTGSFIQRSYATVTGGGALNFRANNLTVSARVMAYDVAMGASEQYDIVSDALSVLKTDKRKDFNDGLLNSINMDYQLTDKSNMGFMYNFNTGNSNMDIQSKTQFVTNTLDSVLHTDSRHRNSSDYHTANLYYDLKIDTTGRRLSLIGNYLSNNSANPVNFTTENLQNQNTYSVRNQSDVDYSIISGQGDLFLPFRGGFVVETGIKYSDISNQSHVSYLNLTDGEFIVDPARSNIFHYNESNMAAYISGSKDINPRWSVKAGLRYEYTDVSGHSPSNSNRVNFDYSRAFPTAYVTYKPNDANVASLNYSKRINRPGFSQLNPFRWYSNPYTYSSGNPLLQPSFSNNLELAYVYNSNLSFTVYYQHVNDDYGRITQLNGTTSVSTFLNYLTKNALGVNAFYNLRPNNWWQSNLFADFNYAQSESHRSEFTGLQGAAFSYSVNNTFFLNEAKTLIFLLNYSHSLPNKVRNTQWDNRANLTAGFNTALFERKLQFSIVGGDLFRQSLSKGTNYLHDNIQRFNNYYDGRRLNVNISYMFGSKKVQGVNRDSKFDEKNRVD